MNSLRLKLLFSHLALTVLAIGVAGGVLLLSLERYFLDATEQSLLAQARITAQTLIPGAMTAGPQVAQQAAFSNVTQQRLESNIAVQTQNLAAPEAVVPQSDMDLSYLAATTLQLNTQLETRVRVLDVRGVVLLDSTGVISGEALSGDELVQEALTGQYASRASAVGSGATMSLALPVMVSDKLVGVVYLSQPLRDVYIVLRDLRLRWIGSTVLALILSCVVGLLFSRAITQPVRRLTEAAGDVAQGRFDTAVPIGSRDELGRLSRAFNDMTARLRAARQMQTDFVANVSHELRTPLTSVKGTIETLRAGAIDDVDVRDRFLETIEGETDRLIRLVNDLLLLTRADSEALNLRREPLDMAELARVTAERLRPQAGAGALTVNIEADPDAPLAWADQDRVAQVLLNVLDNALKYSRPGGAVTIRVGAQDELVLVQVRDTGVGIPAEHLPRIGERFYRADKARARSRGVAAGGSGLGLAIAQAFVQAHGGKLWIESAEGVGTTVSFTLPAA